MRDRPIMDGYQLDLPGELQPQTLQTSTKSSMQLPKIDKDHEKTIEEEEHIPITNKN